MELVRYRVLDLGSYGDFEVREVTVDGNWIVYSGEWDTPEGLSVPAQIWAEPECLDPTEMEDEDDYFHLCWAYWEIHRV